VQANQVRTRVIFYLLLQGIIRGGKFHFFGSEKERNFLSIKGREKKSAAAGS